MYILAMAKKQSIRYFQEIQRRAIFLTVCFCAQRPLILSWGCPNIEHSSSPGYDLPVDSLSAREVCSATFRAGYLTVVGKGCFDSG